MTYLRHRPRGKGLEDLIVSLISRLPVSEMRTSRTRHVADFWNFNTRSVLILISLKLYELSLGIFETSNVLLVRIASEERAVDDEAEVWGRNFLCHISRFTPYLGLSWLIVTMMMNLAPADVNSMDWGFNSRYPVRKYRWSKLFEGLVPRLRLNLRRCNDTPKNKFE